MESFVKQSRIKDSDAQKSNLIKAGGEYFYLKNKYTNLYRDVKGGSKKNNAQVIQYRIDKTDAQKWRFMAISQAVIG